MVRRGTGKETFSIGAKMTSSDGHAPKVSFTEATSILKPILDDYIKKFEERHIDEAAEYYDPDAVLISIGKKATYGREAIKKELHEMDDQMGKAVNKFSGLHYQMTGDYIIINGGYETDTEKMGVLKGKFTQIWRKSNNNYLIIHDEFAAI